MNQENKDPVKNPAHYTQGQYECWDAMEDLYGKEIVSNFCIGCAFKYIWREELKKSSVEDIEKAIVYLKKYADINSIDVSNYKNISNRFIQFYPYYKSHKCEQSVTDYFLIKAFENLIYYVEWDDLDFSQRSVLFNECVASLDAWLVIQNERDI